VTNATIISYKPFWHNKTRGAFVHYNILLALVPAAILGMCHYGMHAVRVICIAIAVSMAAEAIIQKLFKKPVTVYDGSAAITGFILALILPASVPVWLVIIGCIVAILVGKQVFGGLGSNPLNAALVGWAILRISWGDYLNFDFAVVNYDPSFSIKYPLSVLKAGGVEALEDFATADLFLGKQVGGIGASAVYLLLLGGLYLILRGIISWKIPLAFLFGVAVTALLFQSADCAKYASPYFHLVTGNVMIGAFFIATDYSSSPNHTWGQILFGLGCGILTVIFRIWSVYPDGVVFAVLLMNIITPLFDKVRLKAEPGQKVIRA
jgi:electron transport complex protein RnfD